jgi:multimeric flavodoxin WrbA
VTIQKILYQTSLKGKKRMKIVCLLGSPRNKGNSSTLAKHVCDAAEKLGANETFLKWHGFKENYLIRGCGVRNPEDILAKEQVLKQAEEVARKIMG